MKVVAVLCWWDESPTWLSHVIAGAARAGVSHVVAVDGPYALVSSSESSSGVEQHDAIIRACHSSRVGLSLIVPECPWVGNEVEKRSAAFRAALDVTTEADWLLVVDADMPVVRGNLLADLDGCELDVATVQLVDRFDWHTSDGRSILPAESRAAQKTATAHRALFRARRGLEVHGSHYIYRYPDAEGEWRYLWGPSSLPLEPAKHLQGVEVEHWTRQRNALRSEQQKAYYELRDQLGIEKVGRLFMEGVDGSINELNR